MYNPHLEMIFKQIFSRITNLKTLQVITQFLIFLSLLICKQGPNAVIALVNQVQKDIFFMVMKSLWITNIQKVSGKISRKMCSIAMTQLLCDTDVLYNNSYSELLKPTLEGAILLLETSDQEHSSPDDILDKMEENPTSSTFSQLQFAQIKEVDPFENVDPRQYLAQSLVKFSNQNQGVIPKLLSMLESNYSQALESYFQSSNIPLNNIK